MFCLNDFYTMYGPVLLFLSTARVSLVTWQGCVGPQHPDGARGEQGLVGEGDLVVSRELVRLDPQGRVHIILLSNSMEKSLELIEELTRWSIKDRVWWESEGRMLH